MSLDPIESIALIPNSSQNFDEVWMIVNRANGRFVERLSKRNIVKQCGSQESTLFSANQIYLDSSVTYDDGVVSENIVIGTDNIITITSPNHGYIDGQTVLLKRVNGLPNLDNTSWEISHVTTDTFDLITQIL